MSKPRTKKEKPTESILKVLSFMKLIQRKIGTLEQQFCKIMNGWACASNGVITIGTKITEDLNCCPHTITFENALKQVKSEFSLTQLSDLNLSVHSGNFTALVPCEYPQKITIPAPDMPSGIFSEEMHTCIASLAPIVSQDAEKVYLKSVLFENEISVATNGCMIIEYWHGTKLPFRFLVPKEALEKVIKCKKKLVKYGYSKSSLTFWFEDESFIKTQVYGEFDEYFPEYSYLFNLFMQSRVKKIELEFFEALHTISKISKNGEVYFKNGKLLTSLNENEASSYIFENLPDDLGFKIDFLISTKPICNEGYFDLETNSFYFNNNRARGILRGLDIKNLSSIPNIAEDDIPF